MSCILRIVGTNLNLKELLNVSLFPDSTWGKDTPRISTKSESKKHNNSGARYVVSEADFDKYEQQILDAIEFLKKNKNKIQEIMNLPNVDSADLDFGIYRRDVAGQFVKFPTELVKLAGNLGLGIELSQYPAG